MHSESVFDNMTKSSNVVFCMLVTEHSVIARNDSEEDDLNTTGVGGSLPDNNNDNMKLVK